METGWLVYQVMYVVLAGLGVAAIVIFTDRALRFRRIKVDYSDFLKSVFNILDRDNIEEAMAICDDSPGPIAAVVHEAIVHRKEPPALLYDAIQHVGQEELNRLEQRVEWLMLGAQLGPLLGLIGTLVGIRQAAKVLADRAPLLSGNVLFDMVSGAIGVTVAGLALAAVCYVGHQILSELLDRLRQDLNFAASESFKYFAANETRSEAE